jgi:hypothetical protein
MSAMASGSDQGPVEITAATLLEAIEQGDLSVLVEAQRQLMALDAAYERIASDLILIDQLLEES